ncbi:unnamed protein product [Rodentolepis nana]|uniref:START domain-containing protein n=1 Tax=Rodentolepis nana TaxID=102285 RepID=A0A0R3TWG4_RODNA|nr:unnamed protein product [Rodentolepis nana]
MASFTVGDVRPAGEHDVKVFRNLMDDDSTWKKAFTKKGTTVYVKCADNSSIHMVKVKVDATELAASDMYDTLMDPDYRRAWDKHMIEGYDLCLVSPNTDIGYYLGKNSFNLPWRLNSLAKCLKYQKSIFYGTGVRPFRHSSGVPQLLADKIDNLFTFIGKFPAWAVNKIAQIIAPTTVSKLVKAARAYPEWKAQNSPSIKPWIYPEQNKLAPLNTQDILSSPDYELSDKETEVSEDASSTIPELLEDLEDETKIDENNKKEVNEKRLTVVEGEIVPQNAPFSTQCSIPIG